MIRGLFVFAFANCVHYIDLGGCLAVGGCLVLCRLFAYLLGCLLVLGFAFGVILCCWVALFLVC